MSRFHGAQQAGALRDLRQQRRAQAEQRQAVEQARDQARAELQRRLDDGRIMPAVRKSDLARYLNDDPGVAAEDLTIDDRILCIRPGRGEIRAFLSLAVVWRVEPTDDGQIAVGVYEQEKGGYCWTEVYKPTDRVHLLDGFLVMLADAEPAGATA